MVQQLRAVAALPEDPTSVPSTHTKGPAHVHIPKHRYIIKINLKPGKLVAAFNPRIPEEGESLDQAR